ncbi:hypothetical protein SNARM312S_07940 [Streptomyces narbonensis]
MTALSLSGAQWSGASHSSLLFHSSAPASGTMPRAGPNGPCHSTTRMTSTSPRTSLCALSALSLFMSSSLGKGA